MSLAVEGTKEVRAGGGFELEKATPTCSKTSSLLNNVPTVAAYALGTAVLFFVGIVPATIYAVYCVLSTVAVWRFVCIHCPHAGVTCVCGFGSLATRLFGRGDISIIGRRMKLLVALVFFCWIAPPVGGGLLLVSSFSWIVLSFLVAFVVVAFVIAPVVSRRVGCCDIWRYMGRDARAKNA